jgi:pterin-4a-carbinolamine dehydratase
MKLKDLMKEYIDDRERNFSSPINSFLPKRMSVLDELPLSVAKDEWEYLESPDRIRRIYAFENEDQRKDFVVSVLDMESNGHYGKMCVDGLEVTVEVYTQGINKVTELDKEYAKNCDIIFDNALQIKDLDYGW